MVRAHKKVALATLAGGCIGAAIAVAQSKPDASIGELIGAMFIAAVVLGGMLGYAMHNLASSPSSPKDRGWP